MTRKKKGGGSFKVSSKGKAPKFHGDKRNAQLPRGGPTTAPIFSLRDEARNTEHHGSIFSSHVKLRGNHVRFVSAGMLHGDDHLAKPSPPSATTAMANMRIESDPEDPFYVDVHGSGDVSTGLPAPTIRSPSPAGSDSSEEEVVLFKGRRSVAKSSHDPSPIVERASSSHEESFRGQVQTRVVGANAFDDGEHAQEHAQINETKADKNVTTIYDHFRTCTLGVIPALMSDNPRSPARSQSEMETVENSSNHSDSNNLPSGFSQQRLGRKSPWDFGTIPRVHRNKLGICWPPGDSTSGKKYPGERAHREDEDDEAIKDYVENLKAQMQSDDTDREMQFVPRNLSLNDGNDWTQEPDAAHFVSLQSNSLDHGGKRDPIEDDDDWDSVMLEDFAKMSSSSDVIASVMRILAKRERQHSIQYLVQYEDFTIDDARWLPASFLTTPNDLKLIEEFEREQISRNVEDIENSVSASDTEEEDNSDDEEDNFQDEKDILARRLARMTDEQIAWRLSKQEELGLGSEEVLLFGDEDDYEGLVEAENVSIFSSITKKPKRANHRNKRNTSSFPSASLMADVLEQDPYNGFDIMDTERPSLKKKKKGKSFNLSAELSDSETENHLRIVWEADRKSKRLKKAERAQLRAQGLLGKKNKFKPDLSQKYKDGFTFPQILEEVRTFLVSDMASCSMPPMEAYERAFVHRFALKLGLTSKSRGNGKDRFTVISKTTHSPPYDEEVFDGILRQNSFRYGPAISKGGKKGKAKSNSVPGPAVTYRNGDVVGGKAPEIGTSNRGRVMLEKMGWSSGTALGAMDNKGILQPIAQTVRTGKAGLK